MLDFKCLFRNKIAEQWKKGNAGNGRRAMPAMEEGQCRQWKKGDASNGRRAMPAMDEVDIGMHGIPDVEKSPLK